MHARGKHANEKHAYKSEAVLYILKLSKNVELVSMRLYRRYFIVIIARAPLL